MNATLAPVLPSDLEHVIFEVAAFLWPRSIPKFMLVAWRVKIWVEPLLYRTIILSDEADDLAKCNDEGTSPLAMNSSTFLSLLRTKPPSFLCNSVRQLHISDIDLTAADEVLSACHKVDNLWLAVDVRAAPTTFNMPSKRLHCALHALFGTGAIDFTQRRFASVTHLEIFDVPARIDLEVWSALSGLPYLTHLAFNNDDYLPMCLTLLRTWSSLHVLVLLLRRDLENAHRLVEDCRVVAMPRDEFLVDWIKGAYTGNDYWSRAEDFVAKRKSSEINPLELYNESV
ncbi:hypothetical protein C8R47DRAFT_581342 [Mycena vitilis]|nr:hypothetical protein C8R47DRAFT_581342 [Mycena vitilis]